jgi:hypothetical protein
MIAHGVSRYIAKQPKTLHRGCPHYERRLLKYVSRGFSIVDLEMDRKAIEEHPFMLIEPNKEGHFNFQWDYRIGSEGGKQFPGTDNEHVVVVVYVGVHCQLKEWACICYCCVNVTSGYEPN